LFTREKIVISSIDLDQITVLKESTWGATPTGWAYTNPVYVTLEGRLRVSAKDAGAGIFIKITSNLEDSSETKGLFENSAQKEVVLNVLLKRRMVFGTNFERAMNLENE